MSISGAYLSAKIGSTEIEGVMEWTAEEEVEELDRTGGADQGFGNRDAGVKDLTVTMRLFQDTTTGDYATIKAGTTITNLRLRRVAADTNPAFDIPSALVLRSSTAVKTRGGIYVDVTAKNRGSYTTNDPA